MKDIILKYVFPILILTALFSFAVVAGFPPFAYQVIALIFIIFGFGVGLLLAAHIESTAFLNLCAVLFFTGLLMLAINP